MSTSFYPRRPSRLQLAMQAMGILPAPWVFRFIGRMALGLLAIIVLPIVAIAMIPIFLLQKLAQLGDTFYVGIVAYMRGQPRGE